jgi:hypothetical protein
MAAPDPRLTPWRPDLAAASLRGVVEAAAFVEPKVMEVSLPVAPLTAAPDGEAPTTTQLLFGERFAVYETRGGWAWGQAEADGYVGYAPEACFSPPGPAPTHRVTALQAPVYPAATIKSRPISALPFGALVAGEPEGAFLRPAAGGFLCLQHAGAADAVDPDPVATALRFLGAPYVWGGRTAAGIDCSGLVQTAFDAAGRACPRDSDMQMTASGRDVAPGRERRGDLIFWKGHVGLMLSPTKLLHATGHHMAVVVEPLAEVEARVAHQGHGRPLARRRWIR